MEKAEKDGGSGKKPTMYRHVTFRTPKVPGRQKEKQRSQVNVTTIAKEEQESEIKEYKAFRACQPYESRRTRIVPDFFRRSCPNSKYGIDAALQKYTEVLPPFVLRQNRLDKKQLLTLRGPGCYSKAYTSFVDKAKPCSTRCSLSTLVPRFKTDIQTHPGPGAYNLSSALAVISKPGSVAGSAHFQPMSRNPRDNTTVFPVIGKDSVGPGGVYKLVAPTDKYLAGKRFGLMDLNQSARGQHMGTLERITRKTRTGPGMFNIPIPESSLFHRTKAIVGCMLKAARFCPGRKFVSHGRDYLVFSENKCTPGPYTIRELSRPQNAKYIPFNKSTPREGSLIRYSSSIPPCRYYPDIFYKARHVNGHSSLFKSQVHRFPELQSHEKSSKQRIGKLNVRKLVGELYGQAQAEREWVEEDKAWRARRISEVSGWGYNFYCRK